jgi:hypothetical protein
MNDYLAEMPDKRQFLLDMIGLTMRENFEIAETLKQQAECLDTLSKIAREVGHIKQYANGQIDDLAKSVDIKWDINARVKEFDVLRLYREGKR